MGWFWGGSNSDDPTKKLDPSLREYLEKEAPAKYTPTEIPSSSSRDPQPNESSSKATSSDASEPKVPSASLYPDGRYAHLWKTYKPLKETEESMTTGAERVIEQFKQRKDTLHNAAMENCALEHEALTFCFQTGDWKKKLKARVTMCSEENKKFSRCYTTQAKFLQALGYASSFDWDDEKEERIQMHADKLYHQMLDYERRVEEAQAAGFEPPPITSLFNPDAAPIPQKLPQDAKSTEVEIPGVDKLPDGFKPSKPLEQLTPHERELEVQAHKASLEQQRKYAEEASPFMKSQETARQKRQEKAISWFGETIGKWIT
ncbi:hypothetical protein DTO166G4_1638 [Paecilomyces variotii]|nr:hypothetical protein DTO166G4_1638 [Paecilomyces variotii]KAJ9248585.1 hypothetical protein DTO195F2_8805 [Paecilomyces variotii]KAJ9256100.1 hypothetical protein DTO207G8_2670 [Paecilomyces variotii]KAJ9324755.1 hypothetical protein DTO027B3_4217 [Paecilomyces variotii]KAJ9335693.1 hypothetical protein DTO027B5_2556 [Paecilomyces variotii]